MAIENKFERCEPDDPNRCQASLKVGGQCPYKAMPGGNYCYMHGGNKRVQAEETLRRKQYRLQLWQERLDEFSESEDVKSLREEIGILRIVMEETLNKCKTSHELVLNSSKISDLASRIERLVVSCNKLESHMGMLLDKSAALALASRIVEIISIHVTDGEIIDSISSGIIDALAEIA